MGRFRSFIKSNAVIHTSHLHKFWEPMIGYSGTLMLDALQDPVLLIVIFKLYLCVFLDLFSYLPQPYTLHLVGW
jgi:hypothetical protein